MHDLAISPNTGGGEGAAKCVCVRQFFFPNFKPATNRVVSTAFRKRRKGGGGEERGVHAPE